MIIHVCVPCFGPDEPHHTTPPPQRTKNDHANTYQNDLQPRLLGPADDVGDGVVRVVEVLVRG